MKILICISGLTGGGAERAAVSLANSLSDRGHSLIVMTLSTTETDAYTLEPQVRRITLDLLGESRGLLHGIVMTLRRILAVRAVLKSVRPDAVLSMMPATNIITTLAAVGINIPVVVSERTYPPADYLGRLWETLRRMIYPLADHLVVQTKVVEQWGIQNIRRVPISVIPNTVNYPVPVSAPCRPVAEHKNPARKMILAAGRLDRLKGFDILISAFALIKGDFPEWDLVIIGEGADRPSLTALATELGVSERVQLPGRAGNIQDWYDAADLFVLSSRAEGFPNALLEAMASGCAVVSFDCKAGPADIIENGLSGLLVPPEQGAEGLSAALATLMGDDALRQSFAERAVLKRDQFGVPQTLALWERLFKSLTTDGDLQRRRTDRASPG